MQIITWWRELLPYIQSGTGILHNDAQQRRNLVDVLLFLSALILFIFAIVHFFHDSLRLGGLQLALAGIYAACLRFPEQRMPIHIKENVIILGTLMMFLALIAGGGIAKTGIYWAPLLPFLVFAITGIRLGLRWLALFVCGLIGLHLLDRFAIAPNPYSSEEVLYFIVAFSFYVLIAGILDAVRLRQQVDLEHNNHKLQSIGEKLDNTLISLEEQVDARTSELKLSNQRLLQEIEQHKQTNHRLKRTQQQFHQAQKMESLGTLVGGISHDFNNMLSGINANLFLIQRQTKGLPKVQVKLDAIEKLVFHAADMIHQLLTFARKDNVAMKSFDMSPFLAEAIKLAEVSLPANIKLRQQLCLAAMPIVGNATQLQQVMMNLLNNARDALAGRENPEIRVCLSLLSKADDEREQHPQLEGQWMYLSVRDNGTGIAADKVGHIFDPFFSTKGVGEGTGLGLAMCYGAIQSHQGLIEVESELDKGCTFHIYLPLANTPIIKLPQHSVGSSLGGQGETILLVDDDASLRDAHQDVLKMLGYRVIEAHNGVQAIQIYAEQGKHIDLVIMDIMMPEMDGVTAAKHILTMNEKVKIFFASGYDKDNSAERVLNTDLAAVDKIKRLDKPFTVETLSKMIRQTLS